ncbi:MULTISPECIES: SMR family transporter [unclassified Acidovorax]|uniref:SMR family transporter n=1 Tax=unclassified Acidovorax TaxID=2684926 RepID=UPI0037C510F3
MIQWTATTTSYALLGLAIVAEVLGTSALKASDGFTRLVPSAVTAVCYAVSFYLLSLTLKTLPIGIAYAIWSAVGIVLISTVGWLYYGQRLDAPAIAGLGLIVAGVVVVNLFSKTTGH